MTDSERRRWLDGNLKSTSDKLREATERKQDRYARMRSKIDYAVGQLESCWIATSRNMVEGIGHAAIATAAIVDLQRLIYDEFNRPEEEIR